jgi:hypothetical protein
VLPDIAAPVANVAKAAVVNPAKAVANPVGGLFKKKP